MSYMSFFFLLLQTFYRENLEPQLTLNKNTSSKSPYFKKNQDQNLFMPNFTTNANDMYLDDSIKSGSSVVSQWDKLPIADPEPNNKIETLEDDDEVFSEMKNPSPLISTPVRKIVGQLKSELEESKKPQSWAKAVQGEKSVPESKMSENCEMTHDEIIIETSEQNESKIDEEKENISVTLEENKEEIGQNGTENRQNGNENGQNGTKNGQNGDEPLWILPPEEKKAKKKKKSKKKPMKES